MMEEKELKGYLGGFDLTDVLQLISQQQKTGTLTIESDQGGCSWYFKDGMIIGLEVNLSDNKFDLQEMLLKAGRLNPKEANNIRQEQIRLRTPLEQVLINRRILNEDEMAVLNLTRLFELLTYILTWKKGSYTFQVTGNLSYTPFLPPQQSDFVLLEILRQMDELHQFEKTIPSEYTIFEPVSTFDDELEDDFFNLEISNQLPFEEQKILALVREGLPVQDIIDKSLQGRYNVYRTLSYFLEKGLITPKGEKATKQANLTAANWLQKTASALNYFLLVVFAGLVCLVFVPSPWLSGWLRRPPTTNESFSQILSSYLQQEKDNLATAVKLNEEKPVLENNIPPDTTGEKSILIPHIKF